MDIVIVAQYLSDLEHLDTTNGRFIYLAELLAEKNQVEVVTTTFPHGLKRQAKNIPKYFKGCKITAIYEPGYPKNLCLKRISSHRILSLNVKKYLEHREQPDLIYAAIPSLSVADVVAKYCKKNHVKFIIDVQDLWPEAFKMVFHMPVISDLIFWPMKKKADRVYALADKIVAVSQTYANRALRVNKKCKEANVVYLGTDKNDFDKWALSSQSKDKNEIRIAYVGSLSKSYDIDSIIEAIKLINTKKRIRFIIMGEGKMQSSLEKHAKLAGINCMFTGNLPYPQMVEQLYNCDIAVNPIRKGLAGSILNKVADYAMAGLPVINSQQSQEYRKLLEKYHAGINCLSEDIKDIAEALQLLIDNDDLRKKMGENSRRLGKERFDRIISYQKVVEEIICGGKIRLVYIGTLGHSYDITTVLSALRRLSNEDRNKLQFIVIGDGPKREQYQREAKGLPVIFTGMVTYPEMVWLLCHCDIAVNPIRKGAAQSIINKHMDYAMAGLPVISTQECEEYRKLLDSNGCGINCACGDAYAVMRAIKYLIYNEEVRKEMGKKHREVAESLFDRKHSYSKILEII